MVVVDELGRPRRPPEFVAQDASDLAVLLFTAGTAGAPKPAMLTHGSLLANIEQMQSHPGLRVDADDVALGVLPLFHVYGLNVVLGLALHAGAAVSLVDHFHPVETLARVRDDGVTVVAGVPAIFDAWLAPRRRGRAAPTRSRTCGSACRARRRSRPTTARRMRERFGVAVHDGYGLTEASPVVTTTAVERRAAAGLDRPAAAGRRGAARSTATATRCSKAIPVRSSCAAPTCSRATGTTRRRPNAVLVDGWLHTGDIAVADADGWLTLVDRAKDVIIVSGFNVFPGEVEDALRSHRDVDDVAVIGEPHPRTGETVVAFVVAASGSTPDPVELLRHAGRQLARYKLPTRVEVVDALPRTLAGKLVRRELSSSRIGVGRRHGARRSTTRPRSPRRPRRSRPRARSRTLRPGRPRPGAVRRSTTRACRAR